MRELKTLQKIAYQTKGFVKRNSPTILTCIGSAGVVVTASHCKMEENAYILELLNNQLLILKITVNLNSRKNHLL